MEDFPLDMFSSDELAAFLDDEILDSFPLELENNISSFPNPSSSPVSSTDPGSFLQSMNKIPSLAVRRSNGKKAILAEKRRRQILNKQFIALSTVLPGLRKTDKVSILAEAFSYIKKLQQEMETLRQNKQEQEVVVVHKSLLEYDNNYCSPNENSSDSSGAPLNPDIEVRVYGKDVLLTICCEKRREVFLRIFTEIAILHLTVISANVISFAGRMFSIIITAQMEKSFTVTEKNLVERLDAAMAIHDKLSSSIGEGNKNQKV